MFTVLSILVLIWILGFILGIIYLYKVNSKPYLSEFLEVFHEEIPDTLNPNELSNLLYRKIIPSAFTSTILILIKKNIIRVNKENDEYTLSYIAGAPISVSQEYVLTLLFKIIGRNGQAKLSTIATYCQTHSKATLFLMEYHSWKRAASGDIRSNFYEAKKGSAFVKLYSIIGIIFVLINLILQIHSLPIYLLILPIFFLSFYHRAVYKRTYEGNTEYFKWLAYKHTLLHTESLPIKQKDTIYIYSTVLGCLEPVMDVYKEEDMFVSTLEEVIHKSIRRALLNGDRSVKAPWR